MAHVPTSTSAIRRAKIVGTPLSAIVPRAAPCARAVLCAVCTLCAFCANINAQAPNALAAPVVAPTTSPSPEWLDGDAFERQLQTQMSLLWREAPIGDRLQRLAKAQRIAIWLDRRVDPSQLMNIQVKGETIESTLRNIARHLKLGICVLDSVVYIGPAQTAARLGVAAEQKLVEARQAPAAIRDALMRKSPSEWPLLTTPREALQQLAPNIQWASLDAVPHDLMPATTLPAIPISHQLSLVLAGFDLSFSIDQSLTVSPLPAESTTTKTYSVAKSLLPDFQQALAGFPNAQVQRSGSRFRVNGATDLHRQLQAILKPPQVGRPKGPPEKRYSLKVQDELLGGIAKQLAAQLGLKLAVAPGLDAKLATRISFQVAEVTRQQLIDAMLQPAGLSGTVVDGVLQIRSP